MIRLDGPCCRRTLAGAPAGRRAGPLALGPGDLLRNPPGQSVREAGSPGAHGVERALGATVSSHRAKVGRGMRSRLPSEFPEATGRWAVQMITLTSAGA